MPASSSACRKPSASVLLPSQFPAAAATGVYRVKNAHSLKSVEQRDYGPACSGIVTLKPSSPRSSSLRGKRLERRVVEDVSLRVYSPLLPEMREQAGMDHRRHAVTEGMPDKTIPL
jgi:hypothetical protein